MTKLSNNLSRAAKRVFALISSLAVVLTGLVAGVSSPAQAAAVTTPSYLAITRTANQDGTITIHTGESLQVTVRMSASNVTSDGVKTISSDAAVVSGVAGLTYGTKTYMWDFSSCPGGAPITTASPVPCAQATQFGLSVYQTITNSSGSDKFVATNAATAKFTYGGNDLSATDSYAYAYRNTTSSSGIVLTANDSIFSGQISLCVTSGATSANDTLTWVVSTLNGTSPVANETNNLDPVITLRRYTMAGSVNVTNSSTMTVGSTPESSYNLDIYGSHLTAGTYHISVDLQKDGVSVLGSCNNGGGGGGGGPTALLTGALGTAGKAVADAASAEKAFGANITTARVGRNSPDGAGGLIVASPGTNPGEWKIANITAAGPNTKFGATGKISLTADPDAMVGSAGWYGAAAAGWAVDFWNMSGGTDIYWGTKAAAATKHLAVSQEAITTFCTANAPTGYTGGGFGGMSEFDFLNAPTTDPMMIFTCFNDQTMDEKTFIVKVTTGGFTKVVSMSSATTTVAKPCSATSTYVNPAATKTSVAALLIIANTAKSSMGMGPESCNGVGGAAGDRRITTITAAGVAKVYTTNIPAAAVPANTAGMSIAPGSAAGTWVGVVYAGSPAKPTQTIKISAAAVVTKMKAITLDAASVFPQTASSMVPVKQLANGSIIVLRRASVMPTPPAMGQTVKYAVGEISATGKVTTGKVFTLTASGLMDMYASANMSRASVTSAGVVNYYYTSKYTADGGKYKVVTWKNPTK